MESQDKTQGIFQPKTKAKIVSIELGPREALKKEGVITAAAADTAVAAVAAETVPLPADDDIDQGAASRSLEI